MSSLSDYYENAFLNHMFRNESFTPPTAVYAALFTASTGLEANNPTMEVSGDTYARLEITLTEATTGVCKNDGELLFEVAGASWGTITYVAIVDHETNTTWGSNVNVLAYALISPGLAIGIGDQFRIPDQYLILQAF